MALICSVMQVSRSGYYAWRKSEKSSRQQKNESLIPIVQAATKNLRGPMVPDGSRKK